MDIEYLLFLQNFRNATNNLLTPFLGSISFFAVSYILLLPVFIYWCLDKRKGIMIITAMKISQTFNALVKLTACIYRPWIRDSRVIPAGDALTTATGYSFPSGHVMMSVPIYGGLITCTKKTLYRAFWVLMILLTMFARNYLGVHTPQDVLVGCILGPISLFIASWILDYTDRRAEKFGTAMLVMALAGILTLVYVSFKPYPMDYVDGKLLVDPSKMTVDSWGDAEGLATLAMFLYIERRWVKFEPTGWNVKGVILCVIGLVLFGWIIGNLNSILSDLGVEPHVRKLLVVVIEQFFAIIVWPIVLKLFTNKR